jgi:glutathione synthase/RimK-type ligase-like ATP-grasp enzyme
VIQKTLGLDYCGIDWGRSENGEVLLFEANATMVVFSPDADPKCDYRRPAVRADRTSRDGYDDRPSEEGRVA